MAITKTPYMGLALPSIENTYSVGTLPQDWALWLNYNLMLFDGHDHSQIGKQIASVDLEVSTALDLDTVGIRRLNYINFSPLLTGLPLYAPAIYSDATNLWFLSGAVDVDGNLKNTQITDSGSLPPNAGGFFGDYVSASARATFDGPTNSFNFYGTNGAQNAEIDALGFDGVTINISGPTTMATTDVFNIDILKLQDPNTNYGNSALVRQPDNTMQVVNVVGDGSPYLANGAGKSNNVPITNQNLVFRLSNDETTSLTPTAISNYAMGNQLYDVLVAEYRMIEPLKQTWGPGESLDIQIPRSTPQVPGNILGLQGSQSLISAKILMFSPTVIATSPTPFYFWAWQRVNYVNSTTMGVTFTNKSKQQRSFNTADVILVGILKTAIQYNNPTFFRD